MKKLITWVEIPAVDFDRAVEFYNTVFELNLLKEDFGEEKMACFPTGEGAICLAPNFKPSKDGVLVSLVVPDSIEATLQRVESKGGTILQLKTKIEAEGRDYFALCTDSEGNKIGLYGK
jgi:uncharacterized protein